MADRACVFAPGRVNLIGEHTDYNDGLALPFAITEGVTVCAAARDDEGIAVDALDLGEQDRFALTAVSPGSGWRAFARGAVAELQRAGVPVRGARLEISSTIPAGAGLSSSAALEVALCMALLELAGKRCGDRLAFARLCSRIEHDWVGARSGLLDQLAVLCATSGHASLIDFRSLEVRAVSLTLGGHRLVTLDSGQARSHADSGYNDRRAECERARAKLGLQSLRDATLEQASTLGEPLGRRVRHIVGENRRVLDAVAALERTDAPALAKLLNDSHASLRDDFEVSSAEVERVRDAMLAAGALGARLIGGGFGGNVLGLFAPGADLQAGSREVSPGPGPQLLTGSGAEV
jgi:galactokinase